MPDTVDEIDLCADLAAWARRELAMRDASGIGDDYDAQVRALAEGESGDTTEPI